MAGNKIMGSNHQNGNVNSSVTLTEQAIHASELSYRRLFEAAKGDIMILDEEEPYERVFK
jgi:lipid-binding SYLF domain-containing protein